MFKAMEKEIQRVYFSLTANVFINLIIILELCRAEEELRSRQDPQNLDG